MKIQVYQIRTEAFKDGEQQLDDVIRFKNLEDRDKAFEQILKDWRNNSQCVEYAPNCFTSGTKWRYVLTKEYEYIKIAESVDISEEGLMSLNY